MPADPSIKRIAITGVGIVAPEVLGAEAFAARLESGGPFLSEITRFDTGELRSHRAGLIQDFSARGFFPPMKMRRMNYLSRMGLVAAKLALLDLSSDERLLSEDGDRIGVAIGTMFGPVQTSVDYLLEYVEKGASLAPPQLFAESVANAPGSHIAIEYGFRGFNLTFTQRECSVMAAAMFASAQILKGSILGAIVGGVEEINEITFSVLDRIRALATADGDPEEARPFDRDRSGLVVGEGSAMFVFENEQRASSLERRVYAYLTGFGIARDLSASLSNWGSDAAGAARAMGGAMNDAGVNPAEVDAIWASANGSIAGDRVEARAIREVFGQKIPPVVAPKSSFGEYAAAGGLHFGSAVMALNRQRLPGTPGYRSSEAGLELPVNVSPRSHSMRRILVNSLSAGGGIISAILEAAD